MDVEYDVYLFVCFCCHFACVSGIQECSLDEVKEPCVLKTSHHEFLMHAKHTHTRDSAERKGAHIQLSNESKAERDAGKRQAACDSLHNEIVIIWVACLLFFITSIALLVHLLKRPFRNVAKSLPAHNRVWVLNCVPDIRVFLELFVPPPTYH